MNIWNKFCNLKTWQKLGLGIAILSIFRIFAYHNFIIDVQAEEDTKGYYVFTDKATGLQLENSSIISSGPFASNFISSTDLANLHNTNAYPMFQHLNLSYFNSSTSEYIGVDSNTAYMNGEYAYYFPNTSSPPADMYITNLTFDSNDYHNLPIYIEKGKSYQFAFTIYTNGILELPDTLYSPNDFNISGSYCEHQQGRYSSCSNFNQSIEIQDISYFTPYNQSIYTNEHYSYLIVSFKLNDFFPTAAADNLYRFDSLSISMNNSVYSSGQVADLTNYKYFAHSNGTGMYGIQLVHIMEGTDVYLVNQPDFSILSGTNINLTQYEQCSLTDIECHLRNITKGIKSFTSNIIYSLYSLFRKVFVPDFSRLMNHINSSKTLLTSKVPDIQEVMDYGEYFVTRLQNVQPVHTISFSGVRLPGYNTYIIPAFSYDFDTIINDSAFSSYYSLARSVLIVLLSIGWGLFSIRVIVSMLHDTSALKGD